MAEGEQPPPPVDPADPLLPAPQPASSDSAAAHPPLVDPADPLLPNPNPTPAPSDSAAAHAPPLPQDLMPISSRLEASITSKLSRRFGNEDQQLFPCSISTLIGQIKEVLSAKQKMFPELDSLFHQGHVPQNPEKQLDLMSFILDRQKLEALLKILQDDRGTPPPPQDVRPGVQSSTQAQQPRLRIPRQPVVVEQQPVVLDDPPVVIEQQPVVIEQQLVVVDDPPVDVDDPPVDVDDQQQQQAGNQQEAGNANAYVGFDIHRLNRQGFNRYTMRFKAVKDLTFKEYMCILMNRDSFDVMHAPMPELKEGVIVYQVPLHLHLNEGIVVNSGNLDGLQWNPQRNYMRQFGQEIIRYTKYQLQDGTHWTKKVYRTSSVPGWVVVHYRFSGDVSAINTMMRHVNALRQSFHQFREQDNNVCDQMVDVVQHI